ncbi:hypothetical protein LTR15_011468 [Elasticomyces elasticus]|nr:hypothetical protein LTR15_011468 [Elasticomyces elasticus]
MDYSLRPPTQASATRPYIYESLDYSRQEIRLVTLLPGQYEAPLEIIIERASQVEGRWPVYETISYVWGEPGKTACLTICVSPQNGSERYHLYTPLNTAAALKRLRLADQVRVVWCDAVSIDQNNLGERGQQVAIMNRIYAGSIGNLVLLGEAIDSVTAQRIEISIKALSSDAEAATDGFKNFESMVRSSGITTRPLRCNFDAQALSAVLELPWWRRLWTLQEAALAPNNTAMLGTLSIDLTDLARSVIWWRVHYRENSLSPAGNSGLQCLIQSHTCFDPEQNRISARPELGGLLVTATNFQKSEPRDGLYAVLGLLGTSPPPSLAPDYTRPLADVLQSATRYVIEERRDSDDSRALDIFQYVSQQAGDLECGAVASWAIRVDRERDMGLDPVPLPGGRGSLIPRNRGTEMRPLSTADNILLVKGQLVDQICDTTKVCTNAAYHSDEVFVPWIRKMLTIAPLHPLKVIARTIMNGLHPPHGTDIDCIANPDAELYGTVTDMLMAARLPTVDPRAAYNRVLSTESWKCILHRRFLLTNTGRPGLGPREMKPNDVVAILHGASRPYILRPLDSGQYQLVGESYVDGIMRDEEVEEYLKAEPVMIALV